MDPAIFFNILFFGILHSLDPGHGLPLAFLYSIKKDDRIINHLGPTVGPQRRSLCTRV